ERLEEVEVEDGSPGYAVTQGRLGDRTEHDRCAVELGELLLERLRAFLAVDERPRDGLDVEVSEPREEAMAQHLGRDPGVVRDEVHPPRPPRQVPAATANVVDHHASTSCRAYSPRYSGRRS